MRGQRSALHEHRFRSLVMGTVAVVGLSVAGCQQIQGLKDSLLGGGDEVDAVAESVASIESLMGSGQLDAALAAAEQLAQANPQAAEGHYWKGRLHLARVAGTSRGRSRRWMVRGRQPHGEPARVPVGPGASPRRPA